MAVRVVRWLGVFVVAYVAVSTADLWTTRLALRQLGVSEGNVFATDAGGGYLDARAWGITAFGGGVLAAGVVLAAVHAGRVSPRWVRHPVRSFGRVYLVPLSAAVLDRSPLHLVSVAAGFVALRLLAAGNNLLLAACAFGPLGSAVRWVGERTWPAVGLAAVTGTALVGLTVAVSPAAAQVFRYAQRREDAAPTEPDGMMPTGDS